jgi:hypothetical protein
MLKPYRALPESHAVWDAQRGKRVRRDFGPEYKLEILGEADPAKVMSWARCSGARDSTAVGSRQWWREFASGVVAGLSKTALRPTPRKTPDQQRLVRPNSWGQAYDSR